MNGMPIKFRAKCLETGESITFELGECSAELRDDYLTVIQDEVYTILTDTIGQLVGYDENGAEIYEGDGVKDKNGLEYFAALEPCIKIPNIGVSLPFLDVKKVV